MKNCKSCEYCCRAYDSLKLRVNGWYCNYIPCLGHGADKVIRHPRLMGRKCPCYEKREKTGRIKFEYPEKREDKK